MTDDEFRPQPSLTAEIESGDTRRSLVALRDYLAHELDGHRCTKCAMSQLRTGDTAALVLRLQKIIEELAALPNPDAAAEQEGVISLASIRNRRTADREQDSVDLAHSDLGTKRAPRRQGGRRKPGG